MIKKEMIAMLLAGGQGSRLGVLTSKVAKPAVAFGGKYRIIDFPLSNCINSGIDTVGVLTQYQPLRLNTHIGIGIPWDLDRNVGGVSVLPPYEKSQNSEWYTGTANAIYQNLEYMEQYNPEYVLILSGDHIYKMDYKIMLDYHKANNADITIAAMPVPIEEASRFGVVVTDNDNKITEFEEKPEHPKSNLASMGIYIFSWKVLKDALIKLKDQQECDFGKHVIPYCFNNNKRIFAYEYNGYWKDVGTLSSYWEANMELIDIIPIFNLYEEFWKIYTKTDTIPPQYIAKDAYIEKSIIGDGTEVYGRVFNSVIGSGVVIEEGCVIRDSIIMNNSHIGKNTTITKSIIAEDVTIGENVELGVMIETPAAVMVSRDLAKEVDFLQRLKAYLEEGNLAIGFELQDEDEEAWFAEYNLLTAKPVIYAANVSEDDLADDGASNAYVQAVRDFAAKNGSEVFVICAQIEQEISELDEDERKMFLEDLGLKESGLEKLIKASYSLLGLISYLTAGETETRAWTIKKGTKAPQAAGKIHSDFERGFIRAEVVNYQDLLDCGSYSAAKEKGLVGLEGKDYVVKDGDVVLFRFNV